MRSFRLDRRVVTQVVAPCVALLLTAGLLEGVHLAKSPRASAAALAPDTGRLVRPDLLAARLAAKAAGKRVLIQSLATDSSDTYANPDGTETLESASSPYQALVGSTWKPIDTDLSATDKGVTPAAAEGSTLLSSGGTGPLASVTVEGKTLSWSWPTTLPTPTLSGSTATYANVGGSTLPGEDLHVTATATGFEIYVVLNNAPTGTAALKVPLTLAASGLKSTVTSGGEIDLKDAAGRAYATIASPVVYDASGVDGSFQNPVQAAGTAALSGSQLSYTIPAAFLHSPSTKYPVTLDPGINATLSTANWTLVDSGNPTTSYWDSGTPQIGPNSGGTSTYNTFYQFNTAGIGGKHVLSATFNLGIASSAAACSSPTGFSISSTTSSITSATTWNNQPSVGTTYGAYTSAAGDGNASCPAGTMAISDSGMTSLVQSWATAGASAATAEIQASAATPASAAYKSFTTNPTISITYNTIPPKPIGLAIAPCLSTCATPAATNSVTPTLSSQATDPDGGSLRHDFEVYVGTSSSPTTLVTSGSTTVTSPSTAQWAIPSSTLTNGSTYEYRVRAYDGTDYGPWSSYFVFTVDTTAPVAPTVTATGFTSGNWVTSATTGSFAFSDSASDLAGYQWRIDAGTWSGWSTGTSTGTLSPSDGQHALDVQAADQAGNISTTTVTFGVGGGLSSPHDQAQTAKYATLASTAPATKPYVTYQMRVGTTGSFTNVNTANVTLPGTSTHPTWPQAGTVSGNTTTFSALTFDAQTALGSDGVLQLEGCFAADTSGTGTICSKPVTLQVSQQAPSAATLTVGPGSVDLVSGNFILGATDVSVVASSDSLSIGRSISTITANATAPTAAGAVFGPNWVASLTGPSKGAGSDTLVDVSASGYVTLTDPTGTKLTYTRSAATSTTFTGIGDATDGSTLVANSASSPTQYTLTQTDGTATVWTGSGSSWNVQSVTEPGSSTTSYSYDGSGRVTRILGPVPSGVSCAAPTTTVGCRSLALVYATSTVAQSDDPSGMQDYIGRLVAVDFTAANPAAGNAMTTIRMARYGYDSSGNLVGEWDPRLSTPLVTQYSYSGGRLATVTPPGVKPYTLAYDTSGRLITVTRHDDALAADAVTRVVYGVAWNAPGGSSGLPDLSAATTATWGQNSDLVATGAAVFSPDHPASASPSSTDWPYARIYYTDADSRPVDTAAYGAGAWQIDSNQYDNNGNLIWSLTAGNRAQALSPTSDTDPAAAAANTTAARAALLATVSTYSADGTNLIDTLGPAHPISPSLATQATFWTTVDARSHVHYTYDEGAPSGGPYHLVTTTVTSAESVANTATEYGAITRTTGYGAVVTGDTTGWTLEQPTSTSVSVTNPAGGTSTITKKTRYDSQGRSIESRLPAATADGSGNATDAHTTATSYYTGSGSGACVSAALTGLVCSTGPAVQPTSGNPLRVTTYTYNIYGQPLTKVETAGSTVRTTTMSYDTLDRPVSNSVGVTPSAAGGTALPTETMGYSSSTGLPVSVSTSSQTLTTGYDNWGRLTSYTDASGTTSSSNYDIDSRVASKNDGIGTTTYSYDGSGEHRSLVTSESFGLSSAPTTETATYDAAGHISTETLPNSVVKTTDYNNESIPTVLTYSKSGSQWAIFTDGVDAQGRTTTQGSPGSGQIFGYDNAGRLTSVADDVAAPNGSWVYSCTTRTYTLDADSNRTALASYPDDGSNPTSGSCSTATTPSTVSSSYDAADRLTNTGYAYDTLNRTTALPSADAPNLAERASVTGSLSVGYDTNDMVATQAQASNSMTFALDPLQNRTFTTTTSSGLVLTDHYSDDGDSPTAISDSAGNSTRYLTGIGGFIGVVDKNGNATLALENMHGDIIDSVTDDGSVTSPTGGYEEFTEYGAPRPPSVYANDTYGWLGTQQRSTFTWGGLSLMGERLYNPATGRFLSVDPVQGGNEDAYVYPANPVDNSDPTGMDSGTHCSQDVCMLVDSKNGHGPEITYIAIWRRGQETLSGNMQVQWWYGAATKGAARKLKGAKNGPWHNDPEDPSRHPFGAYFFIDFEATPNYLICAVITGVEGDPCITVGR